MNTESLVILIIVSTFIFILGIVIILRGIIINNAEKKASKPKEETNKAEVKEETKIIEEKPLPVGIIKTEPSKVEEKRVEEFAPLREKETIQTEKKETPKSVSQQIKELSPEMKAILFSDVIKPKF